MFAFCSTLCVILDTLFKHLRYEDAATEGKGTGTKRKRVMQLPDMEWKQL